LAESAKKGRPIETANRPISQKAVPASGGRPQPDAIASGSANSALAITATWTKTAARPDSTRVSRCA
jgi:hypothetical protein